MLIAAADIGDLPHAIQLALVPAFLLTAISGILNVMTGRLSRIIDRGRGLVENPGMTNQTSEEIQNELRTLEKRRHLASIAITASTFSALLVCAVIPVLFLEVLFAFALKTVIAMLFIISTLALVLGLAYFLREVHLATKSIRFPVDKAAD
ncbi:MAG: hypothetical protein RL095_3578 [Verrucomicrobiota bacterium]|jgi:hypothetical protein